MSTTAEVRVYSPSDFLYGSVIGEGRFGSVIYAELHSSATRAQEEFDEYIINKHHRKKSQVVVGYAIKMIPKSEILRHNQLHAVLTEKRILSEALLLPNNQGEEAHPASASNMIPKLFCCFDDDSYLYFVLELCDGGTMLDLFQFCARRRRDSNCKKSNGVCGVGSGSSDTPFMDKAWVRYYSGQLIRILEFLHQKGVIHRDVSPKNILFSSRGDIKLCDFGSALLISESTSSSSTSTSNIYDDFVGTADYVSPEMIRGSINCNRSSRRQDDLLPGVDLWSLGCLIYQMSVGESPFHAESDLFSFKKVLDYTNTSFLYFPSYVDKDIEDLILSLLVVDVVGRIGISDQVASSRDSQKLYYSLRKHQFFQDDDERHPFWTLLENDSLEPPYKPAKQSWMTQLQQNEGRLKRLPSW
jgi:serine/threonine protein kinase